MATVQRFDENSLRRIKQVVNQVLREREGEKRPERRYPRLAGGNKLYSFTLTEDMGNTSTKTASCTIYTIDGTTTTEHATSQTLYDPWDVFDGALSGASGPCIKQGGKYYAVNSQCGGA